MQIKIKCPNKDCGKILIVDSEMAGKKGKCSSCDSIFLIPGTPNPASSTDSGTVDLAESPSGELSGERAKAEKPPRAAAKSGERKRSGEKYLDDYVEPKPKKPRSGSGPDKVIDYVDYEEDRPRRARPRRREEDYYEEDYDDYDVPRRRRREDDYDEYFDSPYDEPYGAPIRAGRSRRRSGPNIGLIRAGYLILAIAGCVFGGAVAIKVLIELIWILGSNAGSTTVTVWKIAETLWFGAAVAVIVGYSFLLFFPNRNSSRGLTIAALSVGAINLLVQIVFKIIPMYSRGSGFLLLDFGGFAFISGSLVETLLKIGLMEGLFIAEMILVALALLAMNKQLRDRYNVAYAKQMIIPAGIYGGILLVMGMFALILSETSITSPTARTIWKWVFYLLRVGCLGMLIWYFISYILLMFNTRSAMEKA